MVNYQELMLWFPQNLPLLLGLTGIIMTVLAPYFIVKKIREGESGELRNPVIILILGVTFFFSWIMAAR